MSRNPWLTFALFARHLFFGRRRRIGLDIKVGPDLVRALAKAFLQSAELGVRPGVVGAVLQ